MRIKLLRTAYYLFRRCLLLVWAAGMALLLVITPMVLAVFYHPLFALLLLPFSMWIWIPSKSGSRTHGSARWANYADLYHAGMLVEHAGAFAGKVTGLTPPTFNQWVAALFNFSPFRVRQVVDIHAASRRSKVNLFIPDRVCPHTSMVAPTGGGKTVLAAQSLYQDMASIFVNDTKGLELFYLTALWRQHQLGQKVAVIAPFLKEGELLNYRVRFNPLQLINAHSPLAIDDVRSIASSLIPPKPGENNPFFTNAALMFVTAVLACMVLEFPADECSLPHLRQIFAVEKELEDVLFFMTEKCDSRNRVLLNRLGGQLLAISGRTRLDVLSTINTELQWIDGPAINESLSTLDFNPGDWFNDPHGLSVYFSVPPDRLYDYRAYYRVVVTSLINFIFRNTEDDRRKIRFYLDESYSLGKLDAIYSALIYGRSYGIRLAFFWQALGQIQEVFPDTKADDFVANTAALFSGIRDEKTAEFVSKWIGRHTATANGTHSGWQYSRSRTNSLQGGPSWGSNWGYNYAQNTSEIQRQLIQPEEILQLPNDATILLVPHMRPILARSIRYFQDRKFMRKLTRFLMRLDSAESERSWLPSLRSRWKKRKATPAAAPCRDNAA